MLSGSPNNFRRRAVEQAQTDASWDRLWLEHYLAQRLLDNYNKTR